MAQERTPVGEWKKAKRKMFKNHHLWFIIIVAFLVIVGLIAAVFGITSHSTPALTKIADPARPVAITTIAVLGELTTMYGAPVNMDDEVTVTDPSGKVIGTSKLENQNPVEGTGSSDGVGGNYSSWHYTFSVTVPSGIPHYGITIAGVTKWVTAQQMETGPSLVFGPDTDYPSER